MYLPYFHDAVHCIAVTIFCTRTGGGTAQTGNTAASHKRGPSAHADGALGGSSARRRTPEGHIEVGKTAVDAALHVFFVGDIVCVTVGRKNYCRCCP